MNWFSSALRRLKSQLPPTDRTAREVKARRYRQQAFGPPMTPEERREFARLVEKQRVADTKRV